jgi:predicted component of viral defense system (DUF524 family)
MRELFRISSPGFQLHWRSLGTDPPPVIGAKGPIHGEFRVRWRGTGVSALAVWKDAPPALAESGECEIGPALFEEMEYQIYLKATRPGDVVDLQHRDPLLRRRLCHEEARGMLHGVINFQGQIGRSTFTVLVNDKPEADFEVEVFPTKLDYKTDYRQILAEVQEVLSGLAYEYLRSTWHRARTDLGKRPTRLEWLILLRQIVGRLEQATRQISQQPQRQLRRHPRPVRVGQIRRVDAVARNQLRRGQGRGALVASQMGPVRERVTAHPPESTTDTLEHRWLRHQLSAIQLQLAQVLTAYREESNSDRKRATVAELTQMERVLSRMTHSEPFRDAVGPVPAGFASLQLLSAPGYREAYQLCRLLKMGLRLEGESLHLNLKDIDVLYEYWVFLAIVSLLQTEFGTPARMEGLFRLAESATRVRLIRGQGQSVQFESAGGARITVTYNPQFGNHETTLIPQQPDILIRLEEAGWPALQLLCDAKYRLDATPEFQTQFGSPGPPRDAINVLHRYRDAILELDQEEGGPTRPSRCVIQAAAVFPYSAPVPDAFRNSRLWKSMARFGVGAVPALPSNRDLLREWLLSAFREGGWALADKVIPHAVERQASDWRDAANEPVLVGVLSSRNPLDRLEWIRERRLYYHPLPKTPHRHFRVGAVALYLPRTLLSTAGIGYVGRVARVDVRPRGRIDTPWRARTSESQLMIVYELSSIDPLPKVIENKPNDAAVFRSDRWTSRLGLQRAKSALEIILETEPEWRLYETLTSAGYNFRLRADRIRIESDDCPVGRAWFVIDLLGQVRFDGANGYLFRDHDTAETSYHTLNRLLDLLASRRLAQ